MKRFICMICVAAMLCCPLSSCHPNKTQGKSETQTTTGAGQATTVDQEILASITDWNQVQDYEISFSSITTMIENGDQQSAQGTAFRFDVRRKQNGPAGPIYYGSYVGVNSAFSFEFTYDYYYSDGWVYQIYTEPTGIEELNEYVRYESTEAGFTALFDGIEPVIVTEAEFAQASAQRSNEGLVTISVPVSDPTTLDALAGDLSLIADSSGVALSDLTLTDPVISYAVQDGKLYGYIGSVDVTLVTDKGDVRVFSLEKSCTIGATGTAVQAITLPAGAQSYEIRK